MLFLLVLARMGGLVAAQRRQAEGAGAVLGPFDGGYSGTAKREATGAFRSADPRMMISPS